MKRLFWAAVLSLLFSCRQKIETTRPQVQNITESVYASGKVKSLNQYEVFATVGGIISTIRVKEGDNVKKGDVLFTLVNEAPQLNRENAAIAARFQSEPANTDKIN